MGAVRDGPAAALGGFEAQAESGEPLIGIGAVLGGAQFRAGQVAGGGLEGLSVDLAGLRLYITDLARLGAMADELSLIAAAVVLDALLAADAAMVALIGFGPAREREVIAVEPGQAAVLG